MPKINSTKMHFEFLNDKISGRTIQVTLCIGEYNVVEVPLDKAGIKELKKLVDSAYEDTLKDGWMDDEDTILGERVMKLSEKVNKLENDWEDFLWRFRRIEEWFIDREYKKYKGVKDNI